MAAVAGRYDYQEITDRPLFGESTPRDRILNIIVGGLTGLFVLITLIESFVIRCVFIDCLKLNIYRFATTPFWIGDAWDVSIELYPYSCFSFSIRQLAPDWDQRIPLIDRPVHAAVARHAHVLVPTGVKTDFISTRSFSSSHSFAFIFSYY